MMGSVTLPNTRFTVGEFTRMVRSGALRTTRVELLNGRIYFMTQGARHMVAIEKATEVFTRIKGPKDSVKFQGTLKLSPYSAPDPDIVWLPVPKDTPPHLWPKPILVIEISDTTYRKDSGIKLRTYAYHGVPEYWIENLKLDRIDVYRDPQNPTGKLRDCHYASVEHYVRGQSIPVASRPGIMLSVDELLP